MCKLALFEKDFQFNAKSCFTYRNHSAVKENKAFLLSDNAVKHTWHYSVLVEPTTMTNMFHEICVTGENKNL